MNAPRENLKSYGDLILSLYDRQDRVKEHLTRKIERLDQRVKVLEERGRE